MFANLDVVILAAGKGTRMYSALPKVLHKIGGMTMLNRIIKAVQALGPKQITVVVGHGKDDVIASLPAGVQWVEQAEQLGTGHALKMALPNLAENGHTLVLTGDVPLIGTETLKRLVEAAGAGVGLLTDVIDDATGYGRIIRDADNQVQAIVEEKDCSAEQKAITEFNTGMMVLPNAHLANWLAALQTSNAQGEYYLTDVIALAGQASVPVNGMVVAHSYEAAGVNNKLQLVELERVLQRNQARDLLLAGVTLRDPERLDIRGSLQHGKDVVIDVNVVFEGDCVLGDNVDIGPNCVLKDVVVADGAQIRAFSHLADCEVGPSCEVGPYARLRPGAKLLGSNRVGNFVEIKSSQLGVGTKVNHLTYIGDTTIGARSNVGAGTVTCNYDGVNKYKTQIGDDVLVGSGSMLVAPVTVNNGVTIGAGSVITKACPANQLTLARAKQVTIPNWSRPVKQKKD
ncbi:MAG: bifunctional UDP-N-acetylglucosamine diphosphorylase/glucosamine-1-phosphate N-acetyltransferase GlmU [Neisseriaceae bacterium]|nr:bifunctional UDP-N-acetylglucosamine diphosphorylase/glucosamine-1-phosphate N-acetyltransferase GlmU [Neisseriaceae bacterium]MBP6862410.1 bifunctional UDP-N-acetylglucosamine diphosphorylase/glucosamine-1-phosphate N-acetyltransferase GlmU [Neisseriaceae bacterium]